MRVLQIAPHFTPYVGGLERYVYYLSRELVRAGHDVLVLTSNVPKSQKTEIIDGIKVIRHKCVAEPLRNPITPALAVPRKYFRDFDIIHVHADYSFAAIASVFLKTWFGLPLVIGCHGHGHSLFGNYMADLIERFYTAIIGKAVLNRADKVIVATPSEEKFLCKLGVDEQKITIIPVGVYLETWAPYLDDDISSFDKKYHLNNKRVILVATQIIRRKGIEYLIKAMPKLIENYPTATCLIVGDGDYKKKLEQVVSDLELTSYVQFTGLLTGRDLALAYKSAEVFVLPSLLEGQPTCVMEAFIFSKPVIATDIDGVRDYFKEVAILVPPRSSVDLASAINQVFAEKETARKLGEQGKALVESKFTWQRIVEDIITVYNDVKEVKRARRS